MMKHIKIGLLLALLFGMTGCDEIRSLVLQEDMQDTSFSENKGMDILKVSFSPTYDEMVLDVNLTPSLIGMIQADSDNVRIDIQETIRQHMGGLYERTDRLELINLQNVAAAEARKQKFRMLAVVDLTLPQPLVDEQREALHEIKSVYGDDKVYVSFMHDFGTSETLPLTDYVLQNYFVSKENSGKLLFQSIVEKKNELINPNSVFTLTDNEALLIFSDGTVYDENDRPFDSKHYEYKAELDKIYSTLVKDTLSIYYVQMGDDFNEGNLEASNTLRRMCKNYNGLYQEQFDWNQMEAHIKQEYDLDYCNYRLTLANPDEKVYRGHPHVLFVECFDEDNNVVIASDSLSYVLGSVYDPIIVNGDSKSQTILEGILIICVCMLFLYLVFQYIVPAIQYVIFKKKYVVTYNGKGMVVNNRLVGDSCYMCKDKFHEGDEVVIKCDHTVHKSCWDENEYKCPEYGRRCKEGSHYYNRQYLWDFKNAPYYMNRILMGCLAALGSWILYMCDLHVLPLTVIDGTLREELYLGFCVGLFNVFFMALLSVRRGNWIRRMGWVLLITVVGALGCWSFFAIECVFKQIFDMTSYTYLIDWIPWTLSSVFILYLLGWYNNIHQEMKLVFIACVVGILSMNIWQHFFIDSFSDSRLLLLFGFVVYSITIALCKSSHTFRSDYSFLSVSGSIKPMDIALYKWFRTSPQNVVTIGRSVDCNLQMTWEINGKVSPVQAEIRLEKGVFLLYALEEGVFVKGKPWLPDKPLRLYHGTTFTIAHTLFTYKENY